MTDKYRRLLGTIFCLRGHRRCRLLPHLHTMHRRTRSLVPPSPWPGLRNRLSRRSMRRYRLPPHHASARLPTRLHLDNANNGNHHGFPTRRRKLSYQKPPHAHNSLSPSRSPHPSQSSIRRHSLRRLSLETGDFHPADIHNLLRQINRLRYRLRIPDPAHHERGICVRPCPAGPIRRQNRSLQHKYHLHRPDHLLGICPLATIRRPDHGLGVLCAAFWLCEREQYQSNACLYWAALRYEGLWTVLCHLLYDC